MRSGLATERFDLVELKKTKNKYGKYDKNTHILIGGLAGDIRVLGASERLNQGVKVTSELITIRTYYHPDFTAKKMVQWRGNVFDIVSVEPGRQHREVVITSERKL